MSDPGGPGPGTWKSLPWTRGTLRRGGPSPPSWEQRGRCRSPFAQPACCCFRKRVLPGENRRLLCPLLGVLKFTLGSISGCLLTWSGVWVLADVPWNQNILSCMFMSTDNEAVNEAARSPRLAPRPGREAKQSGWNAEGARRPPGPHPSQYPAFPAPHTPTPTPRLATPSPVLFYAPLLWFRARRRWPVQSSSSQKPLEDPGSVARGGWLGLRGRTSWV